MSSLTLTFAPNLCHTGEHFFSFNMKDKEKITIYINFSKKNLLSSRKWSFFLITKTLKCNATDYEPHQQTAITSQSMLVKFPVTPSGTYSRPLHPHVPHKRTQAGGSLGALFGKGEGLLCSKLKYSCRNVSKSQRSQCWLLFQA